MKALVTGASSGIGKEMCYYLGELGYDVILVARDKKNLEDVASKIKTNTRVIDLDLSKRENAFKLYEMTKDEFDKVTNTSLPKVTYRMRLAKADGKALGELTSAKDLEKICFKIEK